MSNIDVVRKNLGPVTAYKYAVQQGYIGTEQEFAALMASYATVAEEAEAAKDDAIDAKTAAEEAQAAAEAAAQTLVIDTTLTQSGQAADAKVTGDKITGLKEDVKHYNSYNAFVDPANGFAYGDITWTMANGTVHAIGTTGNSVSYKTLYQNANALPTWMIPGAKYYVKYSGVKVRLMVYDPNMNTILATSQGTYFTVPDDLTGCVIRLLVSKNTSDVDEFVKLPAFLNAKSNADIAEELEDVKEDLNGALLLDGAKAQLIPTGTDYDTILEPGNYYTRTIADVNTMDNCPVQVAHRLVVLKTNNATRIIQIVYPNSGNLFDFRRFYNGSTWSEWTKMASVNDMPVVDKTLSIRNAAADALVVGRMQDAIARYADYQMKKSGLLSLLWFRGFLSSEGTIDPNPDSSTGVVTDYIPIQPNTTFKYKKLESSNVVRICEYAADKSFLKFTTLRAVKTSYTVGASTVYIRIGYVRFDSTSEPAVIFPEYAYQNFYAYIPDASTSIPLGLHTMPENRGVLNCIKRARQMTDIKWSVAADIDRVNIVSGQHYSDAKNYFQNKFKAGREYTGLPYSEQNFIGYRKGITQFVTAAANENSRECTQSQYTGDHNEASYFGTVCVTLVSYALHAPQLSSPDYTNLVGLTKLYDLYSNGIYHSIDDLNLCDVLWEHGHVAIITDIIHDDLNHVERIEVSESTKFGSYLTNNGDGDFGGKCRRKLWGKDEFLQWFSSFAIYRYDADFLSAIPYVPNKFIPMVDETPYADDPNLPCVPIDGDHAYYYLSNAPQRNVTVLIRDTGYTHMRIKQNGENYGALIDITGLTEVTVSCDASTEAVYEAYLCTVNNETESYTSKSCYWVELGATTSPTMQANQDGSYTFSLIRSTNVAYPFVVIYNGAAVNTGNYTPITECDVTKVSNGYRYTFTVTPPSGITINRFSLMFDAGEYGCFSTAIITPS